MAAVEVVISKTRGGIDVPRVIIKDIIGNRELTRKVAERARRVSAPEVQFVLTFLIEEIYEQIMEGKKVVIDGLAAFSPRYHDDFLSVHTDPSRKFIDAMRPVKVKKRRSLSEEDDNGGVETDEEFEREIEKFL